jgi:hypothetical protein
MKTESCILLVIVMKLYNWYRCSGAVCEVEPSKEQCDITNRISCKIMEIFEGSVL